MGMGGASGGAWPWGGGSEECTRPYFGLVPPQDTAVLWIGAPPKVVPQLNSILWY